MIANGCRWSMTGQVGEKRELKSQKNSTWVGWVMKIATFGATHEVTVSKDLWDSVEVGDEVQAEGYVEDQKGMAKLICTKLPKRGAKVSA